ncbi:hypothetical protein [Bacillus sp. FJAT-27445]|uniref:hypothetical protein n=1 Tax=Bacillus sp. FJAT-27445 TaxID=1679166 RepID=UPI0007442DBE|nr:hypothetical protein [Bacillus sp. FJAT-27445]
MDKVNRFHILCLGILIASAAYLDSPFSIMNNAYYYETDGPLQAPVFTQPVSRNLVEYEMELVGKRKSNGYIIETYKEYEVRKDMNGKVVERIPGTRIEEIRYRDYSFRQAP